MTEKNTNLNDANPPEWQAPPPPVDNIAPQEPPQMSEAATLGNVFVAPGETFEDLRRKPRFILAILTMIIIVTAYQFHPVTLRTKSECWQA